MASAPRAGLAATLSHLAVDAHAPSLEHVVLVLTGIASVHLRVIVAVVGMAVAVAGWRKGGPGEQAHEPLWLGPLGERPPGQR